MEDDLVEALAHVTVGVEPDLKLVQWAVDQLLDGRGLAEVADDLSAQGWAAVDVEAAVEEARIRTRRARGVVTRDDVAGTLDVRYRRSTSGMAAFYRSGGGPFGIIAFAVGLRHAVASVRHLGDIARRNR